MCVCVPVDALTMIASEKKTKKTKKKEHFLKNIDKNYKVYISLNISKRSTRRTRPTHANVVYSASVTLSRIDLRRKQ